MLAFYPRRRWEPPRTPPPPLHGCFAPARASPLYNVSERVFGARRTDLHAGVLLRLGVDCYDFAGTVRAPPDAPVPAPAQARTAFHSFWPARRAPFDARQEALLRSFLATQAPGSARLVVWSDRDVRGDALLQRYLAAHHDALEVRVADYALLARGTGLEGSALVKAGGAELLRLLVLWREGGVWVDMDSLLTRDLAPLLEHEFVTQWDCNYDKSRHPQTGALMRFFQHSPYLCEAFHILATSPRPRSPADWGARLYDALWPRLVAESLPAFQILPFCFSDGRAQCGLANRLPDPFARDPRGGEWMPGLGMEEGGGLDQRLQKIFAVHLHDEGSRGFPAGGWVQRLLIRRYDQSLAALEGRA
ncbi:hypothetical protein BC834DRAFT_895050 [Gloeopeniophorella convolvens]|nr:hypothetical protein BC834DRAFT_895050 [Gloeopeniophorella convolvens]